MKTNLVILFAALLTLPSLPALAAEKAPSDKSTKTEKPKKEEGKSEKTADKSKEEAEVITKALSPTQRTKLMEIINKGDDTALSGLPGIGASRVAAIKKARPFTTPADLLGVKGIGSAGLADIVAHAKAGFPETTKQAEPAKGSTQSKSKSKSKSKAKPTEQKKDKE